MVTNFNKNAGKPYKHLACSACWFSQIWGRDVSLYYGGIHVDIGGVRQGVSELLQALYTKPLGICCSVHVLTHTN